MLIRKPYDPQVRVQKDPGGSSRTKQADADACDINKIMARYEKTGLVTHVNRFQGDYGSYLDVQDYQTSLNQVVAAREAFGSLPSKIRKRFGNDPGAFLEAIADPSRHGEMVELGLLKAPPEPQQEPAKTPATPPAGDPPPAT